MNCDCCVLSSVIPNSNPVQSLLKFTTCITRTLTWRSVKGKLRVLPDLLNSGPDIASKVTRVRTLANMLAAAPLASGMFSEVDKLVRIYLTIPVTAATGERSLSAVRCIKTYLRSTMSQQRLNNIMLLNVHKDLTDGLDCPPSPGSSWTPMSAAGIFLALCTVHNETHQSDWG